MARGPEGKTSRDAWRRAEEALEESEERFRVLFEQAGDAMFVHDWPSGRIIDVNKRACESLGYSREELLGLSVSDVAVGWPDEKVTDFLGSLEQRRSETVEGSFTRKDGRTYPTEVRIALIQLGGQRRVLAVARDITERARAEGALRESESRYRTLFEQGAVAVFLLKDLRFVDCNSRCLEIFGASREQLLGKTVVALSPPRQPSGRRSKEVARERFEVALAGIPQHFEWLHHRLDGSPFHADVTLNRVDLGGELHMQAVLSDITERKEAEAAVVSLRQRVLSAQEEERRRIARELHDELGQALTGVKMDLAWLGDRLRPDQLELKERVQASLALTDGTLDEVRDLSTRLRPPVLDELGLASALEWQARHFTRRTGVPCDISIAVGDLPLDGDRAIAVFRVFQEALTNISRHAEAGRVEARVDRVDGNVVLEVRDDGKGVGEDQLSSHQSLGLIGMRERAAAFGGAVEIKGARGGGTAVTLRMPLEGSPQ